MTKQTRTMNGTSVPGPPAPHSTFEAGNAGEGCSIVEGLPGCDAGPAGRAAFVVREIRHALARLRARKTSGTRTEATQTVSGAAAESEGLGRSNKDRKGKRG
ncbi:hypothetical protein [Arthrobacter sp. MMS18-M83]|uniref:hypothetical protein n=1 Tax=Arthrobacter sp. MMS18-M83 TaxID=2996261 RepID=UPI00227C8269|nr:hypothetical protein [Arthrobacter sp. MMS18-M83]WAH98172.1 hypothetical protein OW521_04630 [Arthrobacter sp. MMS18-M83]